ncbi:trigger factor [Marinicella sediminis]|uniref:Trigger factor n=1 Tax=Marinicella sediminis TaxID=1792834 RepID=A0ABV7J641_9GAMM|nr:trigger factor [Marinicella sediminis]
MQISIDQSEGLERLVNIALEADDIQSKVDAKLTELGKEVRLKGFRQGKVPKNILKQRFGQHARQEVLGQLMQDSIEKAIKDNELNIVSAPEVTKADDTENGGFEFQAKVELMPQIPEIDFTAIKVEKAVSEVKDKDIDGMIKNLQKQKQDWKESKGKIASKDLVTIEYSAAGKDFTYPEDGTEKMGILLGESRVPEELAKSLVGLKVKEETAVELEFPADFNVKELADKKAKMSLTVTDVRKAKLPKVDEEFVKSFGVESGDVEEFKSDIKKNLERELKQSVSNGFKQNALEGLRSACEDTEVPQSMISRESEQMARQEQQRAMQMGIENAPMPEPAQFEEAAKKRILNTLIIQDIARKQDIKTDFAKVREQINEIAQTFEQPEEVVQMYYKNPDLMAGIEQTVVESQVMEWLESQVSIKEKKQSFDDIMKPTA